MWYCSLRKRKLILCFCFLLVVLWVILLLLLLLFGLSFLLFRSYAAHRSFRVRAIFHLLCICHRFRWPTARDTCTATTTHIHTLHPFYSIHSQCLFINATIAGCVLCDAYEYFEWDAWPYAMHMCVSVWIRHDRECTGRVRTATGREERQQRLCSYCTIQNSILEWRWHMIVSLD